MFERSWLVWILCSLACSTTAAAQSFAPGLGGKVAFSPGAWNGKVELPRVYCVTFPSPGDAISAVHQFFENDSIYLVRADYPDKLMINIVASTLPAGRAPADEIARLVEVQRAAERSYDHSYNVTQFTTLFGPTIGLRIKDVAAAGRSAPFPLALPIYRPARQPIESLSVHRLFVRGPDRFEVAVHQSAPHEAIDSTETEMTQRLTGLADDTVLSLQSCTARMPPRIVR